MEVDIHPITLETTKMLARLYPAGTQSSGSSSRQQQDDKGRGVQLPRLSADDGQPSAQVLDRFFAADFIPPGHQQQQQHNSSSSSAGSGGRGAATTTTTDHESYGVKYVRYLHQFSQDQLARLAADDERVFVDRIVAELGADGGGRGAWDAAAREAVLAYAIAVQARIERSAELLAPGSELEANARGGELEAANARAAGERGVAAVIRADELEVAVELLFLFSNWSATGVAGTVCGALGARAIQRVCLAVELFTRYARHTQRKSARHRVSAPQSAPEPGRVQRLRVGHKALLLLEVTWRLVVGGEAQALRRIGGGGGDAAGQGLARDALRQISESVAKYPLLAPDVRADTERLLPFVHPFDGHLTRVAQLARFGPLRAGAGAGAGLAAAAAGGEAMGSPSTHMLLADMLARMETTSQPVAVAQPMTVPVTVPQRPRRALGLSQPPPRAAREAIGAYVACVRMTRSEREYAEWWRRLVCERGLPLSLTLNAGTGVGSSSGSGSGAAGSGSGSGSARRGLSSDVTINYAAPDPRRRFEFCGIVEAEDLPGLEARLDGRSPTGAAWPASTAPEPEPLRAGYAAFYRALFPLLPALCRALVLTAVNWAPADRELPQRPFLAGVGAPLVSAATCLGVVKYPPPSAPAPAPAPTPDSAPPASPLGGSNVKRLPSSSSSSASSICSGSPHSTGSDSSAPAPAQAAQASLAHSRHAPPELAARLLTQYAQWRAVGGLLMRLMLGLQANHVLQADYMAQLLMNENLIPAFFWWLGTANLDLCVDLPPSIRAHTFMATYARSTTTTTTSSGSTTTTTSDGSGGEWTPAVRGLYDCMRVLR
ncbi:hypothetical protein GGH95_002072, partial [Coemansia sp. RSA 1836]